MFRLPQIYSVGTLWSYIVLTFKIVSSFLKGTSVVYGFLRWSELILNFICLIHSSLGPCFILKGNVLEKDFWMLGVLIATGIVLIKCFSLLGWGWVWIITNPLSLWNVFLKLFQRGKFISCQSHRILLCLPPFNIYTKY